MLEPGEPGSPCAPPGMSALAMVSCSKAGKMGCPPKAHERAMLQRQESNQAPAAWCCQGDDDMLPVPGDIFPKEILYANPSCLHQPGLWLPSYQVLSRSNLWCTDKRG